MKLFLESSAGDVVKAREGYGWPSQGGGGGGGHHLGFPSLEGALLTLAFLTFAVFLVDLIQVNMHSYSHK